MFRRQAFQPAMSFGKIILMMALFVLIGLPMVAYLWETINDLLALKVDLVRIGISIPLLAILVGFLSVVGRRITAWQAQQEQT